MDERTLRALVEAGAIKRVRIVGQGARFHIELETPTQSVRASTRRGNVRDWASLDAAARWVRQLGLGQAVIDLAQWTPRQRALPLR
jgi:hypothetical protein